MRFDIISWNPRNYWKRRFAVMANKESCRNIIKDIHVAIEHEGERKTHQKITRELVAAFIRECERCVEEGRKEERIAGLVMKPILSKDFNDRAQVDLVDYQSPPDGEYEWILDYQDHLSKYSILGPLTRKKAKEVARN